MVYFRWRQYEAFPGPPILTCSQRKDIITMAGTTRKRTSSSGSGRKKTASRSGSRRKTTAKYDYERDRALFQEIGLIVFFVVMVLLFLCNFGMIGVVGNFFRDILFGIFGLPAYAAPILLFVAAAFWSANAGNPTAVRKLLAGTVLFLMAGVVCELFAKNLAGLTSYDLVYIYTASSQGRNGGGVLAGSLYYVLHKYLETIGTVLVVILCSAISFILMTERSLLGGVRERGSQLLERGREDSQRRRQEWEEERRQREEERLQRGDIRQQREEARQQREEARQQREEERRRREQERLLRQEEKENEKILRTDKKVSGVMMDTAISKKQEEQRRDDMHEIMWTEPGEGELPQPAELALEAGAQSLTGGTQSMTAGAQSLTGGAQPLDNMVDFSKIRIRSMHQVTLQESQEDSEENLTPMQRAMRMEDPVTDGARSMAGGTQPMTGGAQSMVGGAQSMTDGARSMTGGTQSMAGSGRPSAGEMQPVPGDARERGESQEDIRIHREGASQGEAGASQERIRPAARLPQQDASQGGKPLNIQSTEKKFPKKYIFPPLSKLVRGQGGSGESEKELKETAIRLQQTLNNFGVKVTITDISQGPSVTRYELQPEQGVKVSRIVSLSDDIKLNLAATDIRIEAPIPGKAAIGIEVPNKENTPVALRDLLESREFKEFPSNLAFAVGKDIGGQTVVTDIAKMPHMLIAGATGSGKSVCINTLIMSILYKAHPDDVKLIMVDPKVVELSVYNGIPHLLIPVVTDPKKASAALHWAVAEMTERYKKFADFNVRDLKGYNRKLETMRESGQEDVPVKMPQIVIIVDELADLMMVAPGEVEESICRLAQLARAAGIHLIIATQRPSVDVITGLIKANMPSRVAFAVSSGVDSRTILDMNGAEKLLGKGDMLFYPQGYSKPARIQGAFVSDKEVSDVVDFLKNQALGNTYAEEIEAQIKTMGASGGSAGGSGGDERDEYFAEAARFVIEEEKATIGMLQRLFKIGFNRAARIMDQLCEYGVVGKGEGTKPRQVLMTKEQFEEMLEEM